MRSPHHMRAIVGTLAALAAVGVGGPDISTAERIVPKTPPRRGPSEIYESANDLRRRMHVPHQGEREMARRRRQMERNALKAAKREQRP